MWLGAMRLYWEDCLWYNGDVACDRNLWFFKKKCRYGIKIFFLTFITLRLVPVTDETGYNDFSRGAWSMVCYWMKPIAHSINCFTSVDLAKVFWVFYNVRCLKLVMILYLGQYTINNKVNCAALELLFDTKKAISFT